MSASRLTRNHHGAPTGYYFYARGSRDSREFAQLESFVHRRGALQDAVRKISSIGAVRKDGLYVDTLQALSRFR